MGAYSPLPLLRRFTNLPLFLSSVQGYEICFKNLVLWATTDVITVTIDASLF